MVWAVVDSRREAKVTRFRFKAQNAPAGWVFTGLARGKKIDIDR
jgi:hypothetical protein